MSHSIDSVHIRFSDFDHEVAVTECLAEGIVACSQPEVFDVNIGSIESGLDSPVNLALNLMSYLRQFDVSGMGESLRQIMDEYFTQSHRGRFALMNAGRYREAEGHIRAAMSLNPFYPTWYRIILARTLLGLDEFDEAILSEQLAGNIDCRKTRRAIYTRRVALLSITIPPVS